MLRSTQFNDAMLRFSFGPLPLCDVDESFLKSIKNHRSCNSTLRQNPFFEKNPRWSRSRWYSKNSLKLGLHKTQDKTIFIKNIVLILKFYFALTYVISNLTKVVNYDYQIKIFLFIKIIKIL